MNDSDNYREKYGKEAAILVSGGLAGFAAIDQALQGDTTMMEIIAENGEKIDWIGHHALGVAGSLTTEKLYDKITDKEENGPGKYIAMIIGGGLAGGLGEAAQYAIPGNPEIKGIYDGIKGGMLPTLYQMGKDSIKKPEYQTEVEDSE